MNDNSILKYSGITGKYMSILGNLKLPLLKAVIAASFRAWACPGFIRFLLT